MHNEDVHKNDLSTQVITEHPIKMRQRPSHRVTARANTSLSKAYRLIDSPTHLRPLLFTPSKDINQSCSTPKSSSPRVTAAISITSEGTCSFFGGASSWEDSCLSGGIWLGEDSRVSEVLREMVLLLGGPGSPISRPLVHCNRLDPGAARGGERNLWS